MMVTGLAEGGCGGGGYRAPEELSETCGDPGKEEAAMVTFGLLWPPERCEACVLCASWQTNVTKSLKVSWPFSWYFVGLWDPLSSLGLA